MGKEFWKKKGMNTSGQSSQAFIEVMGRGRYKGPHQHTMIGKKSGGGIVGAELYFRQTALNLLTSGYELLKKRAGRGVPETQGHGHQHRSLHSLPVMSHLLVSKHILRYL